MPNFTLVGLSASPAIAIQSQYFHTHLAAFSAVQHLDNPSLDQISNSVRSIIQLYTNTLRPQLPSPFQFGGQCGILRVQRDAWSCKWLIDTRLHTGPCQPTFNLACQPPILPSRMSIDIFLAHLIRVKSPRRSWWVDRSFGLRAGSLTSVIGNHHRLREVSWCISRDGWCDPRFSNFLNHH